MKFTNGWKKEFARDFLALGSIPFFILVLVRVAMGNNFSYLSQFLISGILFFILFYFLKIDSYAGIGFILLFFTSNYYSDTKFTLFASLVYLGLLGSLIYLKRDLKKILLGFLIGLISVGFSYYAVQFFIG
jgi:hypothetical protein